MALTILQLQALIDAKPDLRELINQLADYLEANPPAGTTPTIDTVLAQGGALTENRTVDVNGNAFNIRDGLADVFLADNGAVTLHKSIKTPDLIDLDFADDATAEIGGVEVEQLYHTAGAVKVRLV